MDFLERIEKAENIELNSKSNIKLRYDSYDSLLTEAYENINNIDYLEGIKNLLKKIADRNAVIGIIGLGHTGLPLAISFVESGFSVFGIETDKQKIQCLRD